MIYEGGLPPHFVNSFALKFFSFRSKRPPPPPPHTQQILPPLPAKPQQSGALHQRPAPQPYEPYIIAVIAFCDEEVPYRIKISGSSPPTLRHFKEYLPKKGNYR